MAEFYQPPARQPKIAPVVSLTSAPKAKQEEYADLIEEFSKEAPADPLPEVEQQPVQVETPAPQPDPQFLVEVEPDPAEPTDTEKCEFIRSTLGSYDYSKTFKAFGAVSFGFTDRSVELTEALYAQLEKDAKGDASELKLQTDEEWAVWTDRYVLACTLRGISYEKPVDVRNYPADIQPRKYKAPKPEELLSRVRELMKLPRPVYVALMECSRAFDRHVEILTTRALNENFYRTGGAVSQ